MSNNARLDERISPSNYKISISTSLKTFKFSGMEDIKISSSFATKEIALNAKELSISKAYVENKGKKQVARIKKDEAHERVHFIFNDIIKGNALLHVEFTGTNNEGMYGFYRSSYNYKGKQEYLLSSQFEPADARTAFPCFDEPSFKATIDLSLTIDGNLEAVSNMPVKSVKNLGKSRKEVTFQTTPKMSAYLLYIGVGKFEFNEGKYKKKVFRIVTVQGKAKETGLAMEFGKRFLGFYETYFGIDFPLPKMDLLAIPDFAAGAMENWGAISFREVELLGNEKTTSTARKQRVASVIAHELAHQWFGDLVTMGWWDDLWLNESFATFMEAKAVDAAFPEWQFKLQNSVDTVSTALSADQFSTTHPINVKVNDTKEIDEIFDSISYDKGGGVLAMLEDYASEKTFRKGLHSYLKRHAYSNATKSDLWGAIAEEARKEGKKLDFERVASAWIDKTGYPIVEVSEKGNGLNIKQKRFLLIHSKLDDTWPIPLHYVAKGGSDKFMMLKGKNARLKTDSDYIKLNYGQTGLYRVKYPDNMLRELGHAIKSNKIGSFDAWGIENDLYTLARSSRLKVGEYLDFVERYCMKSGYPLNFSIPSHLTGIKEVMHENKAIRKRTKGLIITYSKAILKEIGWKESKNDSNITILLRGMVLTALGTNDYTEVVSKAKNMFWDHIQNGVEIPRNIRSAVYNIASWNGDARTYDKLTDLYKKGNDPEEKRRLAVAIGSIGDDNLIKKALEFSSSEVKPQDGHIIPTVIALKSANKDIVWDWTRKNWKGLLKKYSGSTHMMHVFVENLDIVDDEKTKSQVEEFFRNKANRRADFERAIRQTIELINVNAKFTEFNK